LLGGGEGGVAEKLLDRAQVGSRGEEVRGKGVAKRMRRERGRKAGGAQAALEKPRHRSSREPSAARVDEERLPFSRTVVAPPPGRTRRKICAQRLFRLFAEGNDSLLAALTGDPREAGGEIHVLQVQPRGLGDAEACGVKQLEKGAVAFREVSFLGG